MDKKNVTAKASFVRMSPRKLRLVTRAVNKLGPEKAIAYLKVINMRAAKPIMQVLQQAIANAKNNFSMSPGDLVLESLQIMEGPRGAKRLDKSHGARFNRGIRRRKLSHILVKLSVKEK
jgi:large subunit ribosomal protein L22